MELVNRLQSKTSQCDKQENISFSRGCVTHDHVEIVPLCPRVKTITDTCFGDVVWGSHILFQVSVLARRDRGKSRSVFYSTKWREFSRQRSRKTKLYAMGRPNLTGKAVDYSAWVCAWKKYNILWDRCFIEELQITRWSSTFNIIIRLWTWGRLVWFRFLPIDRTWIKTLCSLLSWRFLDLMSLDHLLCHIFIHMRISYWVFQTLLQWWRGEGGGRPFTPRTISMFELN
jgi:hypothetical protein